MHVAVFLAFYLGFGFLGLWLGLLTADVCCLLSIVYVLFQNNWIAVASRACRLNAAGTAADHDHLIILSTKMDSDERGERGHHSCRNKQKVRRGLWSPEEDEKLINYIFAYGHGCWSSVPSLTENFAVPLRDDHRVNAADKQISGDKHLLEVDNRIYFSFPNIVNDTEEA
ncbi:hypothetical protein ACLOJK_035603 [Asimina triloba]